ncbi:hypothetical protein M7I_6443 [Glarea lozoyensis 74030]|nr:hypothetical protein M7I_6443 [Glarea lozoyensis 74030]
MDPKQVNSEEHKEHVFRQRRGYFCIVFLCFVLSFVCIVFECFALFNIEFCDGEDLTQMYWGFWSILQVGSLIAIGGVLLQFWIILSGVGTPPWAVALGTPVLVFAALGWMFKHISDAFWARFRNRYCNREENRTNNHDEEKAEEEYVNKWMSRAPTLVPTSSEELVESPPRPKRTVTM